MHRRYTIDMGDVEDNVHALSVVTRTDIWNYLINFYFYQDNVSAIFWTCGKYFDLLAVLGCSLRMVYTSPTF
jgi:hypothetical protein